MQQLQAASLSSNLQSLCDSAKLYDPGQEYSEFVRATNSAEEEKVDGWEHIEEIISRYKIFIAEFSILCQVVSFLTLTALTVKLSEFLKIFKM